MGKDERFHRSLKAEVLSGPPFADHAAADRAFDRWRDVYNTQRPHEALELAVPASRYQPSPRDYVETIAPFEYAPGDIVRRVQQGGHVSLLGRSVKVPKAFRGKAAAFDQPHTMASSTSSSEPRRLQPSTLRCYEALNHAVSNISAEQLRLHMCWGNYEGPHHHDVPFGDVIDIVFAAKPVAISFEAANPRHAHEWTIFEKVKLPDGKVLIPGVIESKSNFIEHPELIAQRIAHYARLVGRENVIAGSDCGFGTWVGQAAVDPDIVFAKLAAMAEGAKIATKQFWP